jgi:tetratricopeptide (TPR) repeat protein
VNRLFPTLLFATFVTLATPATAQNAELRHASGDSTAPVADKASSTELETLLAEARDLFIQRKPIDARAKLQKALKLAPKDYRPHMQLGEYYLIEVAHFRLAHKYLRTAEDLFEKKYGSDRNDTLDRTMWKDHANLLYLLAETRLNLDNYQGALDTLDRFGGLYWKDSYPGTRAWVLMKLKRLDEAIVTAQSGLLRGAELGRTYNILGILMSVKGSRSLSLDAFARAIQAEKALGSLGQPATPLNNAGEVYRELFQDDMAEAAWLQALRLPDGCDHILPSLNLAVLKIDELRLFQAERILDDFVACFAQNSIRSDTEHRALIALARGRIALRSGDTNKAISDLNDALERQQWFGKIGTNANDVQFATLISLSQSLAARANVLRDTTYDSLSESIAATAEIPLLELRSWWLTRRALAFALDELHDLEDLSVRNTDTMLEYPSLGRTIAGYPFDSLNRRIKRIKAEDNRAVANLYYMVYLGTNALAHGNPEKAIKLLEPSIQGLREIDRLIKAEALSQYIPARKQSRSWFGSLAKKEKIKDQKLLEELFALLPSHVRYNDLSLPVTTAIHASNEDAKDLATELEEVLLNRRFHTVDESIYSPAHQLSIKVGTHDTPNGLGYDVSIRLIKTRNKQVIAEISRATTNDKIADITNDFHDQAFRHRSDPPAAPVPNLDIVQGVF